jgi:predicted transcriptional regulator
MAALSPDELSILACVREYGPLAIEEVAMRSYAEIAEVQQPLGSLEERGLITKNEKGEYVVVEFSGR